VGRFLLVLALLGACSGQASDGIGIPSPKPGSARLLFGGDVMLGRGVAAAGEADSFAPLAGVRAVLTAADLAVANLESPLTSRPHDPGAGPNALEAAPGSAALLRAAGFDAMGIANNHAGDAGPATVDDTLDALGAAGVPAIGGGRDAAEAFAPVVIVAGGLRVALLAVDATGQGPRAEATSSGVAWWDEERVREAVARARAEADVVAVGIHGGIEYVRSTDPYLFGLAELLAGWGVDVVWGTGSHVIQPIRTIDPDGDGRPTVVATSLGNLLFDQHVPGTGRGALLEIVADAGGVRALRVGTVEIRDGLARFRGWRAPRGDAVALEGGWWEPTQPVNPSPAEGAGSLAGFSGDVVDAAIGDVDGDGAPDLVVSFRRPYLATAVSALFPMASLVDARGRTAHVGVYGPDDLRPRWVAGTLLRPVARLAACDGSLAVAHSTLDDPTVVATGAWRWGGFGFVPLPELAGPGEPACADVDGDGDLDPLVLGRSPR
jgi:poly-gamma-glutamate capsule biosynthesis protein CapA/YwtB (metallophosphatase superfamily)